MTTSWSAPEISRPVRPSVAGERAALEAALDHQRATLLWKCGGLTGVQLAARPLTGTSLSLLGLIRHLTDAERWWFRRHFAGERLPFHHVTEEDPDSDFLGGTGASAPGDLAVYEKEVEAVRAVTAGRPLDATFPRPGGERADLRWLFLHLIEEYARHNGHADLLRERLDGRTGH